MWSECVCLDSVQHVQHASVTSLSARSAQVPAQNLVLPSSSFCGPGIEPRDLYMLNKGSTQPCFLLLISTALLNCSGWALTHTVAHAGFVFASVSFALTGIIGLCHQA